MKTDDEKVALWAYHHCERENAKWDAAPDICPMRGRCLNCQLLATEAVFGNEATTRINIVPHLTEAPSKPSFFSKLTGWLGLKGNPHD